MKDKLLFALMLSALHFAPAYTEVFVHYSFDTLQNGTGTFTPEVTNSTFPGASAVTASGTVGSPTGGESSFTDFLGNTWTGSGSSSNPGRSLQWNPDAVGGWFELTLNTTGLEDLSVRMGVRDAISSGATRAGGFSSFSYDTGSGTVDILSLPGFGSTNNFVEWSMDLSSITAIHNQPSVTFRWEFPDIDNNASVRVDNIQFTAIPEPSTLMLVTICGLFGLAVTRFKRR